MTDAGIDAVIDAYRQAEIRRLARYRRYSRSLGVMSTSEQPEDEQTADALSVEGWRRGVVHERPDV